MRFHIVEMAEKTGFGKSAVSKNYNGEARISDNFYNKFKEVYKKELDEIARTQKAIEKGEFDNEDPATEVKDREEIEELKYRMSAMEKGMERIEQKLDKLLSDKMENLLSKDPQQEKTESPE